MGKNFGRFSLDINPINKHLLRNFQIALTALKWLISPEGSGHHVLSFFHVFMRKNEKRKGRRRKNVLTSDGAEVRQTACVPRSRSAVLRSTNNERRTGINGAATTENRCSRNNDVQQHKKHERILGTNQRKKSFFLGF